MRFNRLWKALAPKCGYVVGAIGALGLLSSGCGASHGDSGASAPSNTMPGNSGGNATGEPPGNPSIAITPMTAVDVAARAGYFVDPYPVHFASRFAPAVQSFSGTTKAILSCAYPLLAQCFTQTPISIGSGTVGAAIVAVGSSITNYQNANIYQDSSGQWQMAVTIGVKSPNHPEVDHWNVILHAHPVIAAVDNAIPTQWAADAVLIGSLSNPVDANYDGKYFEDYGSLYLLYSKRLSNGPARHGIVAQLMTSAMQLAPSDPVVLLQPDDANGGYNSEFFNINSAADQFKLVEVGNVTVIDGKYAMAYSTGAYDEVAYKTAVAWSDTFLPSSGSTYKKVLKLDASGVWGQPNHLEVQYLLQSQQSDWPNNISTQVLSPGVPSFVHGLDGEWYLYFAGYDPSDAPTVSPGVFDGSHRRPYYAKLRVAIPPHATIALTSNTDLASWLTPVTR